MAEITYRLATRDDAADLVADIRACDLAEIQANSGPDVLAAVVDSIERSVDAFAVECGGALVAVGGMVPLSLLSGQGSPWLLGTTLLDRIPGHLTRRAGSYLTRMLPTYPHLLNYVDARNVRSVRWLKRLGFTVHPAEPHGVAGLPFHLFEMKA